jgi:DNA-binding beta-propeller fold protein YncE
MLEGKSPRWKMKQSLAVILFLLMSFLVAGIAGTATGQVPLKRVQELQFPSSVKGRLDHLGVDIRGNRLFVVAEEAHQMLVFDLKMGAFNRAISIDHPHAVLYRDDLNRIYVTDEGKGALNVYDGKSYDLLKSVPLKVDADSMGYDPATHDLYIVNGGDNAHDTFTMLSVVDTTSDQKLVDIKIDGDTLEAMALEQYGNRIYLDNPTTNAID